MTADEPDSRAQLTIFTAEEQAFIETHRVARLATADARGVPHVVPIVYAFVERRFYFVVDDKPKKTRKGLRRLRNIAENRNAALVIDDYSDDWTQLAYLLVRGEAEQVEDGSEYAAVLAVLRRRYPQYRSMPLVMATHPMVRITPRQRHFWKAED
jgi:PPOX class probable F420-dependent enzyme